MVVVVAMRGGAHSAKRAHARLSASLARAQKKEEKKEKKKEVKCNCVDLALHNTNA
jgi:hypothetical protein